MLPLFLSAVAAVSGCSESAYSRIDRLCSGIFPEGEPGAAVLVMKGDKVVFEKGYGLELPNVQKEETSVSASIVIPATSFVPGQEDNVVSTMAGYGFKEITKDEEGNYICYGTEEMVQAYKDSYRNDILAPVKTSMLNDHRAYCIEAISLSEDAKTLTIKTTEDLTEVSTLANYAFANQEIDRIIYVCSNWCQIANDGEKMTLNLEFVGESEPYYTCTPMNGGAVVAEIEASERAAKQAETDGGGTGTDENASTEGDEQEKAANEGGAPEE